MQESAYGVVGRKAESGPLFIADFHMAAAERDGAHGIIEQHDSNDIAFAETERIGFTLDQFDIARYGTGFVAFVPAKRIPVDLQTMNDRITKNMGSVIVAPRPFVGKC
ncbi:hypothetical protein RHAL1_P00057 (plasmid) [Beijerinckiaceae bacterium RH AL1]|nr:hypothetical protein [Beijerinckiaceae bacterium]VVB50262.1 hypothetical protein RHCH11_RHCH11_04162 [Beijerinckiaceae bacterium RH CH11]VVB50271.1 hypothetical protein RHAL8_04159 [Beijerinckiaceae bacterium RH AL8]VVC57311.1 hypothetical protein RHAL1_P00057 [Beijerinckiaceae bacterium RH AL1]